MNITIKNMMKNNLMGAACMLALSGVANAASIVMTPNPTATGSVGDPIVVSIDGIGWVAGESGTDIFGDPALTSSGSSGGGLIVTWDNTIVNLSGGVGGVSLTFPGSQDLAFDPATPELTVAPDDTATLRFDVTSLTTTTFLEDFSIATLTFDAVAAGNTPATLGLSLSALWLDGDWNVERPVSGITLVPTTINVNAVPVPPAVWLFGSGLLGLVGVARRRQAA